MKKVNNLKFGALAVAALYAFWYASTPLSGHFIDGIDSIMGQYGGGVTQCIGPALVIGFLSWRKNYFYASLAVLWLGINLLNIAASGESPLPFLSGSILHGLGIVVIILATLAGAFFTREAPPEPKPVPAAAPIAFGEEWLKQGRPIPSVTSAYPTPAYHSGGGGLNFNTILVIVGIGGAIALYTHGAQWMFALTHSGVSLDNTPWPSNFQKALDQAKTEHKPILLDFTGSDWCSACMQLDDTILDTKAFRSYIAQKALFVEVDMPHNKNQSAALKEQNELLCQKFGIQGFPTLIVLNSAGKIVGNMLGGPADDQVADYDAALKAYIERAAAN